MYRNMYRTLERAPQDTQDGFDFGQYSVLICLAAHWSGPATSAQEVSAFLDYILRVCQSLQNSSVSLAGKALLVVYPMLSYSYDLPLELEFRGKCAVEKGAWRASYPQLCIILYREWIWVNYPKNFVWALRTITTNCRVSFVDLYLVFPTNCRIVLLPHIQTLWFYWNRTVVLSQSLGYLCWEYLNKTKEQKKKEKVIIFYLINNSGFATQNIVICLPFFSLF